MNRISFVGNSHLGTIAARLTRHRDDHGVGDVEHFVSRTYGTVPMGLVGRRSAEVVREVVLPEDDRHGTTLDVRRSDAVVAVALRFSLVQLVDLWRHYQPDRAAVDHAVPWLGPRMWDAYVDAAFDGTHLWRVVRALRRVGTQNVLVLPQPHPAAWVAERPGGSFELYGRLRGSGDWEHVLADWERQVARLEAEGVRVFRQPGRTLASPGLTRSALAKGDPADTAEDSFYQRGDFYHMNAAYAEAVVPEVYRWIGQVTA